MECFRPAVRTRWRIAPGAGAVRAALLVLASTLVPLSTEAAPRVPDKLPVQRVQDLHYGDVLFYFYQDDNFEAITRLNAYEQWSRMPHHKAESELLLGGLYLSLGLHNEAGARFEKLLTPDIPAGVRNRAWFYLAKVWYVRGYLEKAEDSIRAVQGGQLSPALEAEKQHLFANILMRQGKFDEAVRLLKEWKGPLDWTAYARVNLGIALIRRNRVEEADPFLTSVGTLESQRSELLALKDRANLALGYAYLQIEKPDKARPVLERVRLNGPFSNKALLGVGWADAALGNYRGALNPWLELRDRNLLDAAVQESYLAIPYAFGKLNANAQAAENYENAIRSFDTENQQLEQAIVRIQQGNMLDRLLEGEKDSRYGWFWQLKTVPDAPESRYLYAALAGHDFQEGLKNYRDLSYMGRTLDRWGESMEAFGNMIDTRERAYAERLPRADALLAAGSVDKLQQRRNDAEARLGDIERGQDAAALGSQEEQDQWARIQQLEAAIANAPNDEEGNALRERLRLVKGVLYFRLNESFKARLWQQKRLIKDLDLALREAQNRWIRVERARKLVPTNTGEFDERLVALKERIGVLQTRLASTAARQNTHLQRLAVIELRGQQDRLATYQVQARFALASIYDRAAEAAENEPVEQAPSTPPAEGAPPASNAPPATEAPPANNSAPAPQSAPPPSAVPPTNGSPERSP